MTLILCSYWALVLVMAWVGMFDGKVLPVHWFEGSVDGDVYLDMLKTMVWTAVRGMATRRSYWFQQDGASPPCDS